MRASPLVHSDVDASPQVSPLTALTGSEFGPTFSPDGSEVAFTWDGGYPDNSNPYDLYVKVIGTDRLERLTHHPAEWIIAAWSPDGRNIAFARKAPPSAGIFMISALGGLERKLADAHFTYPEPMSLSWSPDGQVIVYGENEGLRQVSVTDGTVKPVETPGCHPSLTPAFSPDGQWLAFSCERDMTYDLEVMPTGGGSATKLAVVNDIPSPIAWSSDSTRVLYTELGRLFAIQREGGSPQPLTFAHDAFSPAVAPSGNRLAYADWTRNINLWRMNLRPGVLGTTSLFRATSRVEKAPDISPDGKKIAVESERSGLQDVWVSNIDGSEAAEIKGFHALTGSPRWSPDGKWVVFDSRESGQARLYLVNPQDAVPRPIDTRGVPASVPRWSRDGKWIYFSETTQPLSKGVFKVSANGGIPRKVTSSPGMNPQEDVQGRTLYFMVGYADGPIHVLDLRTGKEQTLLGMPLVHAPTDWVLAAHGIYFVDSAAKSPSIKYYDLGKHKVTRRMSVPRPPAPWGGLALSPDGSWLIYAQIDRNDSDLMLADAFR